MSDTAKLESALASGSDAISDIFRSANGVAQQLKSNLEQFVKVGGVVADSKKSVEGRLRRLDGRLKQFDERLARREVQLREQFSRMQEAASLLRGQSSAFSSIFSSIRF